ARKDERVSQLFRAGGPSHTDLFDYKPELAKRQGQKADFGERVEAFQDGLGPWLRPAWDFKRYGQSGKPLAEPVADLGAVVDEIAFIHNMAGQTGVHSQGTLLQTTGFNRPGFPGAGCWVSYALRSANQSLPASVVLSRHRGMAANGHKNRDAPFLPADHSGSPLFPGAPEPIADLFPTANDYITKDGEASGRSLLRDLNRAHTSARPGDPRLEARIRSYELAAKMQLAAPEALDISREPAHV